MKNNPTQQTQQSARPRSGDNKDDLAQEAKHAVEKVSERVKETAGEAMGEMKHQAQSVIREQQDMIADKLDCVCEAFHDSAQRLREEDAAPFASLIDKAVEQVEGLSSYLREKEIGDMFQGIQQFARRNPVVFFGGCFVAGLMISRLIKSGAQGAKETMQQYELPQGRSRPSRSPASRSGLERQSSMGAQYGSSTFAPTASASPGQGGTGSAARWEET